MLLVVAPQIKGQPGKTAGHACVDNDEQVNIDSGGYYQSCAELANSCEDDSWSPANLEWLHEVCAATCGLCDAGAVQPILTSSLS